MRDLVIGATGYVGSRLVTALRKAGHRVLAATRNPRRLTDYGWHADVYPVLLDVARPADVPAVLTAAGPIDVLYYLIHHIGQSGYRAAGNAAIAAAARSTGAPRIVYPGGFRPHGPDLGTLSEHPGRPGRRRRRPVRGRWRRRGLPGGGHDSRCRIDLVRDAALCR